MGTRRGCDVGGDAGWVCWEGWVAGDGLRVMGCRVDLGRVLWYNTWLIGVFVPMGGKTQGKELRAA